MDTQNTTETLETGTENKPAKKRDKRSHQGIEREKFDSLIAQFSSLTVTDKAAWTKITGPSGAKVYVSRSKKVKMVDLSGFGADLEGTVRPRAKNGKVEAHLDFRGSEEKVLSNFLSILEHLASLPAPEPTVEVTSEDDGQPKKRGRKPKAQAVELEGTAHAVV